MFHHAKNYFLICFILKKMDTNEKIYKSTHLFISLSLLKKSVYILCFVLKKMDTNEKDINIFIYLSISLCLRKQ